MMQQQLDLLSKDINVNWHDYFWQIQAQYQMKIYALILSAAYAPSHLILQSHATPQCGH
jgi:hypothetical protein